MDYTHLTGKVLDLEKNTVHLVSQMPPQKINWVGLGSRLSIVVHEQPFMYTVRDESWEYLYNSSSARTLVLNDDDFHEIDRNSLMRKNLMSLHDRTLSKDIYLKNKDNPEIINIVSEYDIYLQETVEQNTLVFYILLAVAIFLISLSCLLHYKITTDIPAVVARNSFLRSIGVSGEDLRIATQSHYKLFFIMPTAIGVLYGSLLMVAYTYEFVGLSYQVFIVAFAFVISQYVFYKYTIRKAVLLEFNHNKYHFHSFFSESP
jgi:hypothetical protein